MRRREFLAMLGLGALEQQRQVAAAAQPNIILIVTDDLDARSVDDAIQARQFPALAAIAAQGLTFTNFFVTTPSCAPSRASIFRGQYVHNHGVWSNDSKHGGFAAFHRRGNEQSTVATWLHDAGYRTGLFGKYLNGYETAPHHVPTGWDRWEAFLDGKYVHYTLSDNGHVVSSHGGAYDTDEIARRTADFIHDSASAGVPFFAYVATHAPHLPARPPKRDRHAFSQAQAPRVPSFNEADVSDKPDYVKKEKLLSKHKIHKIDQLYQKRMQTMLAVDDLVGTLVQALDNEGVRQQTYLLFTSDNGFLLGEHRRAEGKGSPYEEAILVPMLVVGPDTPKGQREQRLALNIDLAPTIAALAGATVPDFVDGRSLAPLLQGNSPGQWRQQFLVERPTHSHHNAGQGPHAGHGKPSKIPAFNALRSTDSIYVEYQTGEREDYDLKKDPFELDNQAGSLAPADQAKLSARLADLVQCSGDRCRLLDTQPL